MRQILKLDSTVNYSPENSVDDLEAGDEEKENVETQKMKAQLTDDILKGNTSPVLRRIKASDYGLGIDVIREVLKGLYTAEVLEGDKRNSYKLAIYYYSK